MASTDQNSAIADAARSNSSTAEPGIHSSDFQAQPSATGTSTPAIRTRPESIVVSNATSDISVQASALRFRRAIRQRRAERERYERGSPDPRYIPTEPTLNSASSKASRTAPSLVLETYSISGSSNTAGTRSKSSKKFIRFEDGTNPSRSRSDRTHSSGIPSATPSMVKRSAARVPLSTSSCSNKRKSQGTSSPGTQKTNLTAIEIVIECEIRSLLIPVIQKLTSKMPTTPDSNLQVRQRAQDVLVFARSKKACEAGIGRCCFYVGYTLYSTRDRTQMQVSMVWFERASDASINGYPEGEWARLFINRWRSVNSSPTNAAMPGSSGSDSWIADRVVDMWNYFAHGSSPRLEPSNMRSHIHDKSLPRQGARSVSSRAIELPQWDHQSVAWSRNHPFGKGEIMPGTYLELVQSPMQMPEHEYDDDDDEEQDCPNHVFGGLVDASALNPTSPRPMPSIQEQDDDEEQHMPEHLDRDNLRLPFTGAGPPELMYIHRNPRKPGNPNSIIFDKKAVPPAWKGPQQVKDSHRHHDDSFVEEGSSVPDTRPPDTRAFNLLRPAAELPMEEGPVWRHQGRLFASGTGSVDPRYASARQMPSTRKSPARSSAHLPSLYNPRWARSQSATATSPNNDVADEAKDSEPPPRTRRTNSLSIIATGFNTIGALGYRRQPNVLGKAEEGDSPFKPNAREAGLYQRKPSDANEDV